MTAVDDRTPVLVGTGQLSEHELGSEPVDLLARATRRAAHDSTAPAVTGHIDSIRVVRSLSWRYRDLGALLATRIGAAPRHTAVSGIGGASPQVLVSQAADDIARGAASVILVGGVESWRTRSKFRARGQRPPWAVQDDTVAAAAALTTDVPMDAISERRIGLDRPALVYPLFEDAYRVAHQWTPADHRAQLGRLWASFSAVAATNPNAWSQKPFTADTITTASADNRVIATPYTKLMNANNMVDQAAALIVCSAGKARALGIPPDNWVFPVAAAEAHDTTAISARHALHRSPAIAAAASTALQAARISLEEIDAIDIYSCYPCAVQIAATELGLDPADTGRPLTITGGLSFAGGPWNNYTTHSIATLVDIIRGNRRAAGLITANSGYLTKHAVSIYATEPPAGGFCRRDAQPLVDAQPTTNALTSYSGSARLEAATVSYSRDGAPEAAFLAARTPDGDRTLATSREREELARLLDADADPNQAILAVSEDGNFRFA